MYDLGGDPFAGAGAGADMTMPRGRHHADTPATPTSNLILGMTAEVVPGTIPQVVLRSESPISSSLTGVAMPRTWSTAVFIDTACLSTIERATAA